MVTGNDIRKAFLEYFEKERHAIVASSPLVPRNDPTLMFANSGMVQFKNVFTGAETRPYKRATTAQKCVRAGGKHNDLENVGYTARHHTFFEMLGNFSFGDYFKEDAISFAWNLITKEYGINKEKLCVTVYHDDEQAVGYWKKIAGLPDSKIIRIATSDNFWSMGDTGPCGPCSEIFYDHGDKIFGGPPGSADADGDRFIEIWNLVFMQYEQVTKEKRVNLPKPSIDTGMGLERVTAVMQGVHDNYDTDLMRDLINASVELTKVKADGEHKASHRVIADHLRSSSFLIADGVLPSNEGRGYVLRRIMRRAMRHAHILGCKEPLIHRLFPALERQMGGAYPELHRASALIAETLKTEEIRFKETLGGGLKLLQEEVEKLKGKNELPGDVAFKLYDTFGFPLDLTQDVLKAKKIAVDVAGFNKSMEEQRARARKAWAGSGEAADEKIWFEIKDQVGATEFLGYDTDHASGKILAIVQDGKSVQSAAKGEAYIIVNQTPFYGESGGQVGDTGGMKAESGTKIEITDTQKKLGDLFVHAAKLHGTVKVGDTIEMEVDKVRRNKIKSHHSVTHLLHEALRRRLGTHVAQKGSLVAPDRMRFDISHNKPMSDEEIRAVETEVNARIRQNTAVTTRLMPKDDAVEMGAMAMFGEKYGDVVRVVSMGGKDDGANKEFSVELCGGTHVMNTGDIGSFRILSEGAVSAGVRRIEALAGAAADAYASQQDQTLQNLAVMLKVAPNMVPQRVEQLVEERKKLEREISDLKKKMATGGGASGDAAQDVKNISGIKFSAKQVHGIPARDLKAVADTMKQKIGSGVVVIAGVDEDKASLVVTVTSDLTSKLSAVDLVRVGTPILGGAGGGGRPEMAQGGGPDINKIEAALQAIEQAVAGKAA